MHVSILGKPIVVDTYCAALDCGGGVAVAIGGITSNVSSARRWCIVMDADRHNYEVSAIDSKTETEYEVI